MSLRKALKSKMKGSDRSQKDLMRSCAAVIRNPSALYLLAKYKFQKFKFRKSKTSESGRILTYLVGFNSWKTFLHDWFPDRELVFLPMHVTTPEFMSLVGTRRIHRKNFEIFQWGFKVNPQLDAYISNIGVKRYYMEDGFIRSIGLGSTHSKPFSLSLDSGTAYFDARHQSDMEKMLNTYDFSKNPGILERADAFMKTLVDSGVSKYNLASDVDIEAIYGPKDRKRILVVGQVEEDASIKYGCSREITNNDLVLMAALENPNAQIIYKPHPDVLHGFRRKVSDPEAVKGFALVLEDLSVPLAEAFKTIDHVYTITSQAGFEALMRGIKVTTVGCPFYAGWGLTDDRQPNHRRERKLTVAEVFAVAYMLYPKYFDPVHNRPITPEEALGKLVSLKGLMAQRNIGGMYEDEVDDNLNDTEEKISYRDIAEIKNLLSKIELALVDSADHRK